MFQTFVNSKRNWQFSFKGVCHEIFDLSFLSWFEPIWAPDKQYFRIRFWFRQDIRIVKKLHGVHHTAELDSAVCILPRSQTPWCTSHRRVMKTKYLKKLCSVHSASHPRVKNFKVSVLIVSFKIVISLWCLKILLWQQYCKSQMEWNGAELSALFGADLNKDERCMG